MEDSIQFTSKDFTSRQIGHLGLVAGMIDELGILSVIDEAIPKRPGITSSPIQKLSRPCS